MRFIFSALVVLSCFSAGAQPGQKVAGTASQGLPPWQTFQVDEHLEVQLPVPARLVDVPPLNDHPTQAYQAATSVAGFLITRVGITASEAAFYDQPGQQDNLYTGLTQKLLTVMHGVRVGQSAFHVGKFEGLAVQVRVDEATPLVLPSGAMWALRVGTSIYLIHFLPKQANSGEATAMQNRFLASLAANDAPYTPPVPADWARFKTGRFRYLDSNYQAVTITRTDTTQTEIDTARGMQIVYRLRWTQDGYELNQISSTFPNAAAMQGKPIKVRITRADGNICSFQGNMVGMILTGRIARLED
jgi:hypothetical protein